MSFEQFPNQESSHDPLEAARKVLDEAVAKRKAEGQSPANDAEIAAAWAAFSKLNQELGERTGSEEQKRFGDSPAE